MPVESLCLDHKVLIIDSVSFDVSELDLSDRSKICIKSHPISACLVYGNSLCLINEEQVKVLLDSGVKDLR